MTNEQVIKRINEIREILADYRALTSYDHEALDIAISALRKQSASSEQVDKSIKFPTIYCCRGYDSIQDENGRNGIRSI